MTLHPGFNTAKDLFAKLERDAASLSERVTPDGFFNFVITAWSLCEWASRDPTLPSAAHSACANVRSNAWLQICRDISNGSKHFSVSTYRPQVSTSNAETGFGVGRFGVGAYGVGEWSITVEHQGTTHDALTLYPQVLDTWRVFFARYG